MSWSRPSVSVLEALQVLERTHFAARSSAELNEAFSVLYRRAPHLMPGSIPEHERAEVAARLLARWFRLGIPTMTASDPGGGERFFRRALKNEHISMLRSRTGWDYFESEDAMERAIHGGEDDSDTPEKRQTGLVLAAPSVADDADDVSSVVERFRADVVIPCVSEKRSGQAESLEAFEERVQILLGRATVESLATAWVEVHRPPPDDAKIRQRKETANKALQRLMQALVAWLEKADVPMSDPRYRFTLYLNKRSARGRIGRR